MNNHKWPIGPVKLRGGDDWVAEVCSYVDDKPLGWWRHKDSEVLYACLWRYDGLYRNRANFHLDLLPPEPPKLSREEIIRSRGHTKECLAHPDKTCHGCKGIGKYLYDSWTGEFWTKCLDCNGSGKRAAGECNCGYDDVMEGSVRGFYNYDTRGVSEASQIVHLEHKVEELETKLEASMKFIEAFRRWALSSELCGGPLFDAMVEAHQDMEGVIPVKR